MRLLYIIQYNTFLLWNGQMIIHFLVYPGARYSMLESVILQGVESVEVQTQLFTEMKHSIRYFDKHSFQ